MLRAKLSVYELDDYDEEEDTYWKIKIGETRNPELRNNPHPYYYMEPHPCWISDNSEFSDTCDYLFKLLTTKEFEKLRIPAKSHR